MFKLNKIKIDHRKTFDIITILAIVIGVFALIALLYYQARPMKLADIKVPVATDKAEYYPSQEISGIFFGETYHTGDVKILREVFCKNYRGVIPPDESHAQGDLFATQARPTKLEGETVRIGNLPDDIPIGSNCVIQFTNIYDIQTPFGVRHESVLYYTQNFSITSRGESNKQDETDVESNQLQQEKNQSTESGASSFVGGGDDNTQNNQTTTNSTQNNNAVPPSSNEPVTPPQSCTVNFLGIKLFCR